MRGHSEHGMGHSLTCFAYVTDQRNHGERASINTTVHSAAAGPGTLLVVDKSACPMPLRK